MRHAQTPRAPAHCGLSFLRRGVRAIGGHQGLRPDRLFPARARDQGLGIDLLRVRRHALPLLEPEEPRALRQGSRALRAAIQRPVRRQPRPRQQGRSRSHGVRRARWQALPLPGPEGRGAGEGRSVAPLASASQRTEIASLSKAALFARLEQGHAARVTVVTPNKRLSHALMGDFDAHQIGRGLTVWEAPDILPFGAFVERLWEDALYSDLGETLPLLLTPAQEQHLWEELLAKSELLIVSQAAAQCREAWRLMHQWRIAAGSGNEDLAAFSTWSREYERRT